LGPDPTIYFLQEGKAQKISYTKKRGHIALLKNPKGD
tara:strand:- start:1441 stop:1551 length:111 start_codon:yes stop_codon:yes gene_type:complete